MQRLVARRVLSAIRTASSSPVLVQTEAGVRFVKLRGAAQGTGALVAEVIVAELAEVLGLRVPARSLVVLDADVPSDDRNDELADLLRFSHGVNLGFTWLDGARDFTAAQAPDVPADEAGIVRWLDAFVANPDRTARNPNIILWRGERWLIDHGAALGFQYDWARVSEDGARRVHAFRQPHLYAEHATEMAEMDDVLAGMMTRDRLEGAVAQVPDEFLRPMLGADADGEALRRRRGAYVAYLWKRLKAPREWGTA
jgi:hypothetical protein